MHVHSNIMHIWLVGVCFCDAQTRINVQMMTNRTEAVKVKI